jgi:hypothetical protein
MSELQAVAEEFKKWKGTLFNCRYPSHLWDKAHQLTAHHPLKTIASALGLNLQYLKHKLSQRRKSITFAPVQITAPMPIKIEIKQITFHTTHEQLESVIQTLLKDL